MHCTKASGYGENMDSILPTCIFIWYELWLEKKKVFEIDLWRFRGIRSYKAASHHVPYIHSLS
jgi:hypothetical protein